MAVGRRSSKRALQKVLGQDANVNAANPLPVDNATAQADMEEALRTVLGRAANISGDNPSLSFPLSEYSVLAPHATGLMNTHFFTPATPSVPASDYWSSDVFTVPGERIIYTRRAYKYPFLTTRIIWTPITEGAPIQFFTLEPGTAAAIYGFIHGLLVGVDTLYLRVGADSYDITAIAPADWTTAWHRYTIVKFPGGAEYYIDSDLVGVSFGGSGIVLGIVAAVNINDVLFIVTRTDINRFNRTEYLHGMIAIEGAFATEQSFQVSSRYFRLLSNEGVLSRSYRVIDEATLAVSTTTTLADCGPVLAQGNVSLTAECIYPDVALVADMRVDIYSSADGANYDTNPLYSFTLPFVQDSTERKTVELSPKARFLKALITNQDATSELADVRLTVSLGG